MKITKNQMSTYSNNATLNNTDQKASNSKSVMTNFESNNLKDNSYNNQSVRLSSQDSNEIEQSMQELKNFIEIVAPSNSESIETCTNRLSFRPKNLPKKSKEEEEYHRKLVEENRKSYLESIHQKHLKEMEYRKRLEKKLIKQQELSKVWVKDLIPNWSKIRKDKKIKEYFYMGLPPSVRGRIWMLCLGNKFSITKEYYQIQVNNSIEILKKYQKQKENRNKMRENNIKKDDNQINDVDANDKESEIEEEESKDKEKSIIIIELDIERTFPYLGLFKGNSPMAEDLREILRVFVISRPDIGYIQGVFMIEGVKAIYSAAIVFLSHFEEKLMNMDFVEIMSCIGSINTINFDEDMVIEAMKKVKIPDWIQVEIDKLNDENIPI